MGNNNYISALLDPGLGIQFSLHHIQSNQQLNSLQTI